MSKKKVALAPLEVSIEEDAIFFQVRGDLLHNSDYQAMLDVISRNRKEDTPKKVIIITYTFSMFQVIHYSLSGLVDSIQLGEGNAVQQTERNDLPDAACM